MTETAPPAPDITFTLPLSQYQGWVLLVILGIFAASALIFLVMCFAPPRKTRKSEWSRGAVEVWFWTCSPILLFFVGVILWHMWKLFLTLPDAMLQPDELRVYAAAFGGLTAALAGLAALPFALIRVYTTERQTRTAEQGHLTDRISKAIEQLGAEKTVKIPGKDAGDKDITVESTAPNIEVRIGGIYALERIAQDSMQNDRGRDHLRIMEILCAYVRENAPAKQAEEESLRATYDRLTENGADGPGWTDEQFFEKYGHHGYSDINGLLSIVRLKDWARNLPPPRTDIQTALDVIGRRSPDQIKLEQASETRGSAVGYRLDLRNTILQRADRSGLALRKAQFKEARLEGADLQLAWLEGADLGGARLEGADLSGARLEGAYLGWARLKGAALGGARLEGADLSMAQLEGADLSRTTFDAATSLTETSFQAASVKEMDFTLVRISDFQVKSMFGDASVILPGGKGPNDSEWPRHWPKEVLDGEDFESQWRAWQASIGYNPPAKPLNP